MTLRQRIRFYQQLAVLMRAGVPLRGSLERLNKRGRDKTIAALSRQLGAGERLGDAFAAAGFLPFESHLVAAGERSAQLQPIFEHLSEHWAHELRMRQALIRPLIYPIVVLHLALVVGLVVESTQASMAVAVTHFVGGLLTFYAAGFLIYIVARASWGSQILRRVWYYVPLVGSSLATTYAYRWISALRLEFGAGISLYRAVGDAWRASGYANAERIAEQGEEAMQHGAALSHLMLGWKQLPRDWIDFVETGEVSGMLEEAFRNLEAEAAERWSRAHKRMAEWLPKIAYFVVLLFAAYQVFGLAMKLFQPILDVQSQLKGIAD